MAKLVDGPPLTANHRISHRDDGLRPISYQTFCLCGWKSQWNPNFMQVEKEGRSHLRQVRPIR